MTGLAEISASRRMSLPSRGGATANRRSRQEGPGGMTKDIEAGALASMMLGLRPDRRHSDIVRAAELAERTDAYVATTIETVCRLERAMPVHSRTGRQADLLAEVKRRLEALEDLATSLRVLAART
jgi:hypothetical protein